MISSKCFTTVNAQMPRSCQIYIFYIILIGTNQIVVNRITAVHFISFKNSFFTDTSEFKYTICCKERFYSNTCFVWVGFKFKYLRSFKTGLTVCQSSSGIDFTVTLSKIKKYNKRYMIYSVIRNRNISIRVTASQSKSTVYSGKVGAVET